MTAKDGVERVSGRLSSQVLLEVKELLGVGEWSYRGGSQALLTPLWLPLSGERSRDQVLWVATLLTQPN